MSLTRLPGYIKIECRKKTMPKTWNTVQARENRMWKNVSDCGRIFEFEAWKLVT